MKNGLLLLSVLISSLSFGQRFIKNDNSNLKFTEMQLQFSNWQKSTDIKKERGWKYFKRWEAEMQLHTDAQGQFVEPKEYLESAIKLSQEKTSLQNKTSNAVTWYPAGPAVIPDNLTGYMENGIGRINCIAFHPTNPQTYFVGVAQGGLWKTTNNGTSWTPLTDNLPIDRVSDIAIDPNNPNTMYISVCDFEYIGFGLLNGRKRNTHFGIGVYKTTDGGTTWQPTGLSFSMSNGEATLIRKILINSGNSNKLVAAGVSGVYTSNDAGTTWTNVLDSLFWDLTQDPQNPNTLYAATGWVKTANIGSAAIYKSTDFGQTWALLNTGIPTTGIVQRVKLAIAPNDNNYIYAATVDLDGGLFGIYKSTDAGNNWSYINPGNVMGYDDVNSAGGQGTYDLGFAVNSSNKNKVYIGGINLWASDDGANTFNPATHWTLYYGPTIHGDIHFIAQQPLTGNMFVCSDGGIYRTTGIASITWNNAQNGTLWPTQWTNIGSGMQATSFYRISSSRNATGRIIGGAQDNASMYYDGSTWSTVYGGDGMDNYLDPLDDNYMIVSSQYGNFAGSSDGGFNFSQMMPNVNNENAEWTSPIEPDYNNPGVLYAGFTNVSKSIDNGNSWQAISNFPISGAYDNEITAIAATNTNTIYATKRVRYEYGIAGSVYRTSDGGANWTDVTAGLPDSLYYTGIAANPNNANEACVVMAQFSAGNKIFKTSNKGNTWQNISYNLPNIPVNCVKYIPGPNGTIMIGTDLGIYVFDAANNLWVTNSLGLPNVIVTDIDFNVAINKVYLSTFGRGIWSADMSVLAGIKTNLTTNNSIKLYPNINVGNFTIEIPNELLNSQIHLSVIDGMGRIVMEENLKNGNNNVNLKLVSGMYYARISTENNILVKQFVIADQ